jgi:hypothetical protein
VARPGDHETVVSPHFLTVTSDQDYVVDAAVGDMLGGSLGPALGVGGISIEFGVEGGLQPHPDRLPHLTDAHRHLGPSVAIDASVRNEYARRKR